MHDFKEIVLEEYNGIAKISINRPRYRNAFTPLTTAELSQAFSIVREAQHIRVVLLTGAETPRKEGQSDEEWLRTQAFCSGGDMNVKGRGGYIDGEGTPRLSVLDVQMQFLRRWLRLKLSRKNGGTEESKGDMVPLPPIHGTGGSRHGHGEQSGGLRQA